MVLRPERLRCLRTNTIGPGIPPAGSGPVIYWIQRERRVHDNWALLYAIELHRAFGEASQGVRVCFCIPPSFLGSTMRQYDFKLHGFEELERELADLGIPFDMLTGSPDEELPPYLNSYAPSAIVTDFEPLRTKRNWTTIVVRDTAAPFHQVDAHNVVPAWIASSKEEYAAATLRPKIERLLPTFLEPYPEVVPVGPPVQPTTDWQAVRASVTSDPRVAPVSWLVPGEQAGRSALAGFLFRLDTYQDRNDPIKVGQSDLSPYLHFGQLAPQRAALDVCTLLGLDPAALGDIRTIAHGFLEELIIRRELADNFTHYNDQYDQVSGFHEWAQRSLNEHRSDRREHTYHYEDWDEARTHDELWNAAQRQMVRTGKMHGFMRMYWAKKILEWSHSPEEALATAIALNDRYSLDGRDPNGYAGIAWSIGGVHDRAWTERPVYGKIRYMNANGCRRKFDVDSYIASFPPEESSPE